MIDIKLIAEVALRCGDSQFEEFEKTIYKRGLYRANREVAKHYEILEKVLVFTLSDMIESTTDEIILDLPDLKAESMVIVNNANLTKVDKKLEGHFNYVYYLELRDGRYYFNYILGDYQTTDTYTRSNDITSIMSKGLFERIEDGDIATTGKTLSDKVTIVYTIIPNLDTELGEFFIPDKYEEEQIERSLHYMSKLGMAKYPTGEKFDKWENIFRLYKVDNQSEYDKKIVKDREFIKIQPFIYP